jgi:3-methyladenine DNA glycosylase AlkD
MSVESILAGMRSKADPKAVAGMAKFGISSQGTLGLSMPLLRSMAGRIGRNHELAQGLWNSGVHEARILAALVDEPKKVTELQMEKWVADFDSWDVCDGCCGNLFDRTPFAYEKAVAWSKRGEEFVKRAGYVLMAELAVHDKEAPDDAFLGFFGPIERGSTDSRNFVKKGVNWALRQIGKRNLKMNRAALQLAGKISKMESPSAKWIASDAIRELKSEAVQKKLRRSS